MRCSVKCTISELSGERRVADAVSLCGSELLVAIQHHYLEMPPTFHSGVMESILLAAFLLTNALLHGHHFHSI